MKRVKLGKESVKEIISIFEDELNNYYEDRFSLFGDEIAINTRIWLSYLSDSPEEKEKFSIGFGIDSDNEDKLYSFSFSDMLTNTIIQDCNNKDFKIQEMKRDLINEFDSCIKKAKRNKKLKVRRIDLAII